MRSCCSELYFLNPKYDRLFGQACYRSLHDLPGIPTHAFIAVRRDFVLPYLKECAEIGIRHVVIISSGFKEKDEFGRLLELEIEKLVSETGLTVLGPNTLGFIHTAAGFNGTFLPSKPPVGSISVISQSGGVGMALLSSLEDQRCGVNKWIGIGNEAGVSALEALNYLAEDPSTKAIAVCFEGLRDLGSFLRRAAEVNKRKPIVFLRDGKSSVGLKAAASHTGALVFSGNVLPSLFRQFGLLEANSTHDCAVMLKALSTALIPKGKRAVLLTNTAGPSVLAADLMENLGVQMPPLPDDLSRLIDKEAGVEMGLKNPADISSNGLSPRNYGIAAKRLLASDDYDLLLGFFSLNPHLILPEQELIDASRFSGKPVVACFLASQSTFAAYSPKTEQAGIPCFCDAHDAALACASIIFRGETLRKNAEPAYSLPGERLETARTMLAHFGKGRRILSERESKELLSAAGLRLRLPHLIHSPAEALSAAETCGYPVALKLESSVVTHKSAVGGVRLNIAAPEELAGAVSEMLPRLRNLDPDAALTVQPMSEEGFEWIIGAVRSPLGILLTAGQGGRYAEQLQDNAFCLWPADHHELSDLLHALRCSPVLQGQSDESPLVSLLSIVGALMESFPELSELEVNPCRITKDGLWVLDARAVLSPE